MVLRRPTRGGRPQAHAASAAKEDWDQAIAHGEQALALTQQLGDGYAQAAMHGNLTGPYAGQGDQEQAALHAAAAVVIFRLLGAEDQAQAVGALLVRIAGSVDAANRWLEQIQVVMKPADASPG